MEERLIKNLYMFAILFFIIGIPMMSMGYLDNMNANNYIIVHANITEYMHAQFYLKNKIAECHILTENNEKTHQYYEYKYPIGSTIKLFYDFNTKICRTEKFVTNLAIAGLFFFILSILVCTIGCYADVNASYEMNNNEQKQNQTYTNINTINDTDIENQNTKQNIPSAPPIQTAEAIQQVLPIQTAQLIQIVQPTQLI